MYSKNNQIPKNRNNDMVRESLGWGCPVPDWILLNTKKGEKL